MPCRARRVYVAEPDIWCQTDAHAALLHIQQRRAEASQLRRDTFLFRGRHFQQIHRMHSHQLLLHHN